MAWFPSCGAHLGALRNRLPGQGVIPASHRNEKGWHEEQRDWCGECESANDRQGQRLLHLAAGAESECEFNVGCGICQEEVTKLQSAKEKDKLVEAKAKEISHSSVQL